MKSEIIRLCRRLTLLLAAFELLCAAASAADFEWDRGGATDDRITQPLNWVGDVAPPNDGTARLFFSTLEDLGPYTVTVDTPFSVSGIRHGSITQGFVTSVTISGQPFTIGVDGIDFSQLASGSGLSRLTFDNDVILAGDQQWDAPQPSIGNLRLNGDLSGTGVVTINDRNGVSRVIPVFSFSGENSGFTGTIQNELPAAGLPTALHLGRAASMIGGNIDFSRGEAGALLVLEGTTDGNDPGTYTFGIGSDSNEVRTGINSGGLTPLNGIVRWDPGAGGDYNLDSNFGIAERIPRFGGMFEMMTPGTQLRLTGGNRTIGGDGFAAAPLVLRAGLGDDGTPRRWTVNANVTFTEPATGTGGILLRPGSLRISNMNQLSAGNLDLNEGVLILENISWGEFTAARSYGTGAGQWQFRGGGFAAVGTHLVIDNLPAGASLDTNLSLGHAYPTNSASQNRYVLIQPDMELTGRRRITVQQVGVVAAGQRSHEISGDISGQGALMFAPPLSGASVAIGEIALTGQNTWTGSAFAPFPGSRAFNTGPGGLLINGPTFVRFDGDASLPTGGTSTTNQNNAFLAALREVDSPDKQAHAASVEPNSYGFLLTGRAASDAASGEVYDLPAGYKFVIGGVATSIGGRLGAARESGAPFNQLSHAVLRGSDVAIHGPNNFGGLNFNLFLDANNRTIFTLGQPDAPVRFQPTTSGTGVDSGLAGAATTLQNGTRRRTLVASGEGVVVINNVAYTSFDGTGDTSARFAWQVGARPLTGPGVGIIVTTGSTTPTGTLRETGYGAAANASNSVAGFPLAFEGGVLETSGEFTRSLGINAGQVQWLEGAAGGFSAFGGDLLVDIGGDGPTNLAVDGLHFLDREQTLFFGTPTGNGQITFVDNIFVPKDEEEFRDRPMLQIATADSFPMPNNQKTLFTGQLTGPGRVVFTRSTPSSTDKSHPVILTNDHSIEWAEILSAVIVNGSLHNAMVSGGLLGGSGSANDVFLLDGAISPGDFTAANRVGQFDVDGLMGWIAGDIEIEVRDFGGSTPGVDWDLLTIAGTLDLEHAEIDDFFGPFIRLVSLDPSGAAPGNANFDYTQNYSLEILRAGGGILGIDPSDTAALNNLIRINQSGFTPPLNGGQFHLTSDGTSIFLNYTFIPEPSTAALLLLAMAWLPFQRRCRLSRTRH